MNFGTFFQNIAVGSWASSMEMLLVVIPISSPWYTKGTPLMVSWKAAKTSAFYFVAKGDGSSHFSATLDEHNRAVNRYQRGR